MLISWINEWPCSVLPLTLGIERVQLQVQLSHSFMSSTANILAGFSPGRECLLFISSVPTHHLDYFSAPGSLTLSFAAFASLGFSLPPTHRLEGSSSLLLPPGFISSLIPLVSVSSSQMPTCQRPQSHRMPLLAHHAPLFRQALKL